ncbi:hypothetical protein F7725_024244, partial [Dissostichus mawsoni]
MWVQRDSFAWLLCVCGRDITFLKDVANKVPEEMPTTSVHLSAQPSTSAGSSAVESFQKYREIKKRERKTFFTKGRHNSKNEKKQKLVKISVGVMRMMDGCLKPVRGRSLPLDVEPQWSCEELLAAAVKKQKAFNQDLEDGAHVLLYPDARVITNIPGTDTPFTVQMYKEAIGKPYQRITLYICTLEAVENKYLTTPDVVAELSAKINNTSCSRFNINRANVWDGAIRGFKRASFDPSHQMQVKFTDDEGQTEDGVDTGGPKREFPTLLMECLRMRRIFDGPEDRKFLTFDNTAAKDDEYFHAGRMIATSIVHGGPGPRFLSETLYQHLTGMKNTNIEAIIEDITDDTMRASLL